MTIAIAILMIIFLGNSYNDEKIMFWKVFYMVGIIYFSIVLYGAIRIQMI